LLIPAASFSSTFKISTRIFLIGVIVPCFAIYEIMFPSKHIYYIYIYIYYRVYVYCTHTRYLKVLFYLYICIIVIYVFI
jgi:hypothetical protein